MPCSFPALIALACLPALAAPTRAAPPAPVWDPATTWALVAGVLRWQDPALAPFDARHRKDAELMKTLAARGVPAAQRTLLLDRRATAGAIVAALTEQVTHAPRGSTFLVYFEGHGLYDDAGRYRFATADAHTEHLDTTGLDLSALLPVLGLRGPEDRVLLLGDACYSGHMAAIASALGYLGVPAAALTSASELSASSENWTFTQALIDGLSGRPILDRDGDGAIRLGEVAAEARAAMRHREGQPIGFASFGFPDLALAAAAPWPADLSALDPRGDVFARGDWVVARRLDGERGIARVLGAKRDPDHPVGSLPSAGLRSPVRLRLEFYDYTDRAFGWAKEARVDPVMFFVYPVGTMIRVEDDEVEYAARVLAVEDGMHLVDFVDWAPGTEHERDEELPADEFVTPDQILGYLDPAIAAAQRVLVQDRDDGGDLYEAFIKGRFHGEVCVRYAGSPFVEDDCVPEARVSPDRGQP